MSKQKKKSESKKQSKYEEKFTFPDMSFEQIIKKTVSPKKPKK